MIRFLRFLLFCFVSSSFLPQSAPAAHEDHTPLEYKVKAAYLLNFTRYVEWPAQVFASSEEPFVIGLLGRDGFGEILGKTVDQRKSQGRPVETRRFQRLQDVAGCQVLFIGHDEDREYGDILRYLKDKPILTVGESERFLKNGGHIALVIDEKGTVRFKVNLSAAEHVGLRISSRMLNLAKEIYR